MPSLSEILQQVPDSFLNAEMMRRRCKHWEPQCLSALAASAAAWGADPDEIRHNHTRLHSILRPRQASMFIMRGMGLKLPAIAAFFDMNHATVIWAIRKHPLHMASPEYAARFEVAMNSLPQQHTP